MRPLTLPNPSPRHVARAARVCGWGLRQWHRCGSAGDPHGKVLLAILRGCERRRRRPVPSAGYPTAPRCCPGCFRRCGRWQLCQRGVSRPETDLPGLTGHPARRHPSPFARRRDVRARELRRKRRADRCVAFARCHCHHCLSHAASQPMWEASWHRIETSASWLNRPVPVSCAAPTPSPCHMSLCCSYLAIAVAHGRARRPELAPETPLVLSVPLVPPVPPEPDAV